MSTPCAPPSRPRRRYHRAEPTLFSGVTRKHLTPAVVVLAAAATVAALVSVVPAEAATIPKPPAVCNPTGPVGGHPVMTSFARTPGSIDVTHSAGHLTFTVHAKDSTRPITGRRRLRVVADHRLDPALLDRDAASASQAPARTAPGEAGQTIPRWTNPGTWKVTEVDLGDSGGGYDELQPVRAAATGPGAARGPRRSPSPQTPDRTAPTVTSVNLSKTTLDTRTGAAKLRITVHATDAASGVLGHIDASATVRASGRRHYSAGGVLKRVHGDSHNGTYVGVDHDPALRRGGHAPVAARPGPRRPRRQRPQPAVVALRQRHQPYSFRVISKTDASKPTLTAARGHSGRGRRAHR